MEFKYEITYQNKQNQTVTVVYTPADSRALPTVDVVPYTYQDSEDSLRARILARAPLEVWKAAIGREQRDFDIPQATAGEAEVFSARAAAVGVITFEQRQQGKTSEIDRWRLAYEQAGMPWVFPGGVQDVVQLRDDRDRLNVTGLCTSALVLKGQGVTDPVFPFQAQSNTTHNMTPDDVLAMGLAVSAFTASLYQTAWSLKERARAATTDAELEAVQWPVEVQSGN